MAFCTSPVLIDLVLGDPEQSPIQPLGYNSDIPTSLEGLAEPGSSYTGHYSPSTSWKPLSPILSPYHHRYQNFESHFADRSVYPSPPSTSSPPGRTVPLPRLNVCVKPDLLVAKQPFESFRHSCAIDSPPNFKNAVLNVREPLSPPPTLPTQTLSLPPAEPDPTLYQEMQVDNHDGLQDFPVFPLATGSGVYHHPVSPPLSPGNAYIKAPGAPFQPLSQASIFLPSTHPSNPSPLLVGEDVTGIHFDRHPYTIHDLRGPSPSRRLWQPDPTNFSMNHSSTKPSDTIPIASFFSSPQSWYLPEAELAPDMMPWGYTPGNTGTPLPDVHITDLNDPSTSPPFFYATSPPFSSPATSDYELDNQDYDDGFMTSLSPPSSPASLRSFSELPTVEGVEESFGGIERHRKAVDLPILDDIRFSNSRPTSSSYRSQDNAERAPSIRSFPGVETDDELIPLDLASRSSAPEHCIVIPSTPYITPSTLFSFPSSSHPNSNSSHDSTVNYNSGSLLLHDDYPIGSPPDNNHYDSDLDQLDPEVVASDPELKWLLDLRKRVLASERQARLVEAQYENIKSLWLHDINEGAGAVGPPQLQQEEVRMQTLLAMQAKKARKGERERLKEINALVKIKLTERGVLSPPRAYGMDLDSLCSHKDSITSMPQLVARMTLRRRESHLRPRTKPRHGRSDKGPVLTSSPPGTPRLRRSSPLSLTAEPSHDNQEPTSDKTMASQNDSLSRDEQRPHYPPLDWHMDVDCHACQSDSTISSLDDLDLASPFDMLRLSDT